MQNFPDITPRFLDADAAIQVPNALQLEITLGELLSNPARCESLGKNALAVVDGNRGALERTIVMISDVLQEDGSQT